MKLSFYKLPSHLAPYQHQRQRTCVSPTILSSFVEIKASTFNSSIPAKEKLLSPYYPSKHNSVLF